MAKRRKGIVVEILESPKLITSGLGIPMEHEHVWRLAKARTHSTMPVYDCACGAKKGGEHRF